MVTTRVVTAWVDRPRPVDPLSLVVVGALVVMVFPPFLHQVALVVRWPRDPPRDAVAGMGHFRPEAVGAGDKVWAKTPTGLRLAVSS